MLAAVGHSLQFSSATVMVAMLLVLLPVVVFLKLLGVSRTSPRAAGPNCRKGGEEGQRRREGRYMEKKEEERAQSIWT